MNRKLGKYPLEKTSRLLEMYLDALKSGIDQAAEEAREMVTDEDGRGVVESALASGLAAYAGCGDITELGGADLARNLGLALDEVMEHGRQLGRAEMLRQLGFEKAPSIITEETMRRAAREVRRKEPQFDAESLDSAGVSPADLTREQLDSVLERWDELYDQWRDDTGGDDRHAALVQALAEEGLDWEELNEHQAEESNERTSQEGHRHAALLNDANEPQVEDGDPR